MPTLKDSYKRTNTNTHGPGRRTKKNRAKNAHHAHLGLALTHMHALLCSNGLSTWPPEGLNSWWPRNLPAANNNDEDDTDIPSKWRNLFHRKKDSQF